jgi:hypothetical protein
MSPGSVVIGKVRGQDSTEIAFIEHDDVIETPFCFFERAKGLEPSTFTLARMTLAT